MDTTAKKRFIIDASTNPDILRPWHQHLKRAWPFVLERTSEPTLFELTSAIINKCGLSYEVRQKWVDTAHEIRESMGVENLCEVPVSVNL